jgi:pseudouridine-5'-monophosphatase
MVEPSLIACCSNALTAQHYRRFLHPHQSRCQNPQNSDQATMPKAGSLSAPKACLFDLDGLLLDTEPLQAEAWKAAAACFNGSLSTQQLQQLKGRRRDDNANLVCSWLQQSVSAEQLLKTREPIAKRLVAEAPAVPGAEQLIRFCSSQHLPMVLVTSSKEASLLYKISGHSWLDLIQSRVLGDDMDLRAGKPAPDPYLLATQRLGLSPSDCWVFEDSPAGCQSALAAGCWVWQLVETLSETTVIQPPAMQHPRLTLITSLGQGEEQLRHSLSTDG